MKSEWSPYPLGTIADFIDYRGKTPPKTASGIPLVTAKIVKDNVIQKPTEFISTDFFDAWMTRGTPKYGNVVFTTEAPLGEVAQIKSHEKLAFAQRIIVLQGKKGVLDDTFLFYALQHEPIKKRVEARSSGTTVFGIKSAELKKVIIELPSIDIQKKIAETLSALDAKIANNNAINQHLEQMAQAIFKSWFVDFEPWGGEMPEDWREGTISDLGDVIGGSTPSKAKPEYYTEHGIAWITPKDLSINKNKFIAHGADDITELGLRSSSARIMPRGTVLFSSRAPIGYIAITSGEVCTNQGFKSVVPKKGVGTAFVYFFLKENLQTIDGMASGSTFKEVSGSTMKCIPAIIPDADALRRFQEECTSIFEKQELLESENARLVEIRDALLPRLMSGELSVADIVTVS